MWLSLFIELLCEIRALAQLFDQFDPWEMHVYHADLAGFGILPASSEDLGSGEIPAVPEPGTLGIISVLTIGLGLRRRRKL